MKLLTIDFTFFLFLPNKMGILNEKRCNISIVFTRIGFLNKIWYHRFI